ncbi:hypothetical protein [Shewanella seohaensis]|uniref:O-antigen polysaccharide polymerase Wzy n=1 Tax=Shewanella seohaensis TaxID=755175 RepID=A0ABV4VS02_9GAMM
MTLCNFEFTFSKGELFKFLLIITLILFQYMINQIDIDNNYSWIITLVIWSVGVYTVRGSLPVLFVFIFIFSYISVPFHFFILHKQIGVYDDFQSIALINHVSFLNTLFISVLTLFLSNIKDVYLVKPSQWFRSNKLVFYVSLIPCVLSVYYGISGSSLLDSGYGTGNSEKSPLHEYFVIFIFFPLVFKEINNKLHELIIFLIVFVYSFKTIIYGGRIEVLQAGLLYCYLTYNYLKDISKVKLYTLVFLMFFVMSALGAIRGSFYQIISNPEVFEILKIIFLSDSSSPYLLTTSGDVYYASMRMLGMIDIGILDFETRIVSFFSFLFNVFLSFSPLKANANLAAFNSDVFPVGGGGLISAYFYVWLSYFGVILSSAFIGYSIKLFHGNSGVFIRIYGLMLLVTFPRWWGYTPINLTKLCVIAIVIYALYRMFSYILSKKCWGL